MPIRELPKELQELAVKEINEDPKRIPEDLSRIREWLSKQSYIKARTDDQFLVTFLRGCKYSLERTKEKLDMHYTLRTITPELFKNRDPLSPEIQKILSLGVMIPMPKLADPAAPRYFFAKNSLVEEHKLSQSDVFKVGLMINDILLMEDDSLCIAGCAMIQDMSNLPMSYFLSLSPSLIKKGMTCYQHAYPFRIKGAYFFNITAIFEKLHALFRPFLTEKVKKRMGVYNSLEELAQFIPKEVLPEEYGGQSGKFTDIAAYWKAKVESYRDWFLEDEKYGTDEKKRPGKPKTSESVFGLEGSFRQLAVD